MRHNLPSIGERPPPLNQTMNLVENGTYCETTDLPPSTLPPERIRSLGVVGISLLLGHLDIVTQL